jgi:pimeloyl-ACP methyl ester carboxylesterase
MHRTADPAPARRAVVAVDDAEVAYAVEGGGPGLVLVHGTGGSAETNFIGQTLDHMVPVAHARDVHAAIPATQYAELPTGHLGIFEQPEAVAETIRSFLLRARGAQPE